MQEKDKPSITETFDYSVAAIKRGDLHVGKRGLIWVIRNDPENVNAWLWLAYVTEDIKLKVACYQHVIQIDQTNETARKALKKYGQQKNMQVGKQDPKATIATRGPVISELEHIKKTETDDDPVKAKLDLSRRELLDLSLNNKLLNYKPLKTKGVVIIDEIPKEIYRILVTDGRLMSFSSVPEEEAEEESMLLEDESTESLGQPQESVNHERHTDSILQTPYTSSALQKRLLNTYYAARTYIEEQGVNILFIALGMLRWYDSQSSDLLRKAPIVLIPVELSRTDIQAKFRVQYSEEEIEENLSLRSKLQSDFGISLPKFPDSDELDLDKYFSDVSECISNMENWSVDEEAIALAFFSFGKFLMYKDLASDQWSEKAKPEDHFLLRRLLHQGFKQDDSLLDEEHDIDTLVSPDETFQVVDADSSQSLAILEANKGHNLVIQGPPGTGKSQTITNLIAEAIGHGKTALFVSEKAAALEVVKRRLDQVGLGDACLELHSHKTNKKVFLNELRRSLELGQPYPGDFVDIHDLRRTQQQLNAYSKAVNTEVGDSQLTPYEIYGQLIQAREFVSEIEMPKLNIEGLEEWSFIEINHALSMIEELQLLLEKMGRPIDHPFWGSRKSLLMPAAKDEILEQLSKSSIMLHSLRKQADSLSNTMMLPIPATVGAILARIAIVEYLETAPDLEFADVAENNWINESAEIALAIDTGIEITKLRQQYAEILKENSWNENVIELRETLIQYGEKWWRGLSSNYREAKHEICNLFQGECPKAYHRKLEILNAIIAMKSLIPIVEGFESNGKALFGSKWNSTNSEWNILYEIFHWLKDLHIKVNEGRLPPEIINFVSTKPDIEKLQARSNSLLNSLQEYEKACEDLINLLEINQALVFGKENTLINSPLVKQAQIISVWQQEIDRFQEFITFRTQCRKLSDNNLQEIATIAIKWHDAEKYLYDLLKISWLNALIQRAMKERPILAEFDGEIHNHALRKFCDLDTKLLSKNRIRLAYEHWTSLPKHQAGGQLGVLAREFAKKRRHKPIRSLIAEAGNVIQVIKPVFMMSPLSVAKFIMPETVEFDMVIFDEASQVKPVDAFGAILRSKQLIVVGDDKQLPPTSFFETTIDVDEDYSESPTADLESILGLSLAQGMPQKMLRWHYRSQHESLITVSNFEFYDDKLVIFPSPDKDKREVGLVYHYLPNTEYGRGKNRSNIGEAKEVANAVMEHARQSPDLTLGVAAFSISQRDAIRDQLEILRRMDPNLEPFFRSHPEEPFFIKNLENVQGDERDVIFISVGYGRTHEGKISMNFGPLNQDGGERRLNVLITRARRRCEVFTNLQAEDIDLSRTQARGVQVLKRFLKYADSGDLDLSIPTGKEPDSPFEEAVASKLQQLGYRVEAQVGSGGFYIDLAIIDEDHPGRYVLGIECDGATYHSAKSARDRDRLRQEILENLGWRIHRIWSTDWFRNPERETQKLEKSIAAARLSQSIVETPIENQEPHQDTQSNGIGRKKPNPREKPAVRVLKYQTTNLRNARYKEKLHEVSRAQMAEWIRQVVEVESPVHKEEIARRIINCAGVKRLGRRIKQRFELGLMDAERKALVTRRGDFLWRNSMQTPEIRTRVSLPSSSKKIEFIAPEEIEIAILQVVDACYGIEKEDIPSEVCQLIGFQRTTEGMSSVVNSIINSMIKAGKLTNQGAYLALPD